MSKVPKIDPTLADVYVINRPRNKTEIRSLVARVKAGEKFDPVPGREFASGRYLIYPRQDSVAIAHCLAGKKIRYEPLLEQHFTGNRHYAVVDSPKGKPLWVRIQDVLN